MSFNPVAPPSVFCQVGRSPITGFFSLAFCYMRLEVFTISNTLICCYFSSQLCPSLSFCPSILILTAQLTVLQLTVSLRSAFGYMRLDHFAISNPLICCYFFSLLCLSLSSYPCNLLIVRFTVLQVSFFDSFLFTILTSLPSSHCCYF